MDEVGETTQPSGTELTVTLVDAQPAGSNESPVAFLKQIPKVPAAKDFPGQHTGAEKTDGGSGPVVDGAFCLACVTLSDGDIVCQKVSCAALGQ